MKLLESSIYTRNFEAFALMVKSYKIFASSKDKRPSSLSFSSIFKVRKQMKTNISFAFLFQVCRGVRVSFSFPSFS